MNLDRLRPLRYVRAQQEAFGCASRFCVWPAGRRSGKTDLALRWLVFGSEAVAGAVECNEPDGEYWFVAPTHMQARQIAWSWLKAIVPRELRAGPPSETMLDMPLVNGATIRVRGMDKPERVEGGHIDRLVVDEVGNMKASAWTEHLRPMLSTPGRSPGMARFIGVPEPGAKGMHYREMWLAAIAPGARENGWCGHTWPSWVVVDAAEVEAARRDLDELTFAQEYGAQFVTFSGRAYYAFSREVHAREKLRDQYDDRAPLFLCFDFNVEPGVAAIVQEMARPDGREECAPIVTAVIGQVWIPRSSNTGAVCRRLLADWGAHRGDVAIDGDATGGGRTSASDDGMPPTDWRIVRDILGRHFGVRFRSFVPRSNPGERDRVNAMNSRLLSSAGVVSLLVDPTAAPQVVRDLEDVTLLDGGSGEIHKRANDQRTHISDALGYHVARRWPVGGQARTTSRRVVYA